MVRNSLLFLIIEILVQSYRWIASFLFLDDIKIMHSANNDKAETEI